MGNLADYIIRASFMQERMVYRRDTHQVEFRIQNGNEERFSTPWYGCPPGVPMFRTKARPADGGRALLCALQLDFAC